MQKLWLWHTSRVWTLINHFSCIHQLSWWENNYFQHTDWYQFQQPLYHHYCGNFFVFFFWEVCFGSQRHLSVIQSKLDANEYLLTSWKFSLGTIIITLLALHSSSGYTLFERKWNSHLTLEYNFSIIRFGANEINVRDTQHRNIGKIKTEAHICVFNLKERLSVVHNSFL